MNIDKASLVKFRIDFASAIKELETKNGVKIDLGSIRFGENEFTSKIKVTNKITSTGKVIDEQTKWNDQCYLVGLNECDFGAAVTVNGMRGKLVDIKPRSFKYPIIVEAVDGKRYKMSTSQVKSRLIKV